MPSVKARILNLYLNWAMKRHPLHLMEPEKLTAGAEAAAPKKPPAGVSIEKIDGDVSGEWHRSENAENGNLILYLHGGGYYFGSPKTYRALTFALAQECKADVFSLHYRMAPKHPFPAAVDDAFAAYLWLLDQGHDAGRIVLAGDSAGGGLGLALMLSIRDHGLPKPAGAILYSPWTDLAVTGASISSNEKSDAMFRRIHIEEGAKKYLAGADPTAPLASPLYADFKDQPPILIFTSDSEILFSDSTRLHDRLKDDGVSTELIIEEGLAHIWPAFIGRLPEAAVSLSQSADFARKCFSAKVER